MKYLDTIESVEGVQVLGNRASTNDFDKQNENASADSILKKFSQGPLKDQDVAKKNYNPVTGTHYKMPAAAESPQVNQTPQTASLKNLRLPFGVKDNVSGNAADAIGKNVYIVSPFTSSRKPSSSKKNEVPP